jgi:predicted nuclease with TOPRIM domain
MLKIIETKLSKLQVDIENSLNAIDNSPEELHRRLIELTSKYPDHSELIQFIVFSNDRLNTNQQLMREVIQDSFKKMIELKRDFIEITPNNETSSIMEKFKTFKDIRIALSLIALIALGVAAILNPQAAITIVKMIIGL